MNNQEAIQMNHELGMFQNVLGLICDEDRIHLQTAILATSYVQGDLLEVGCLQGLSALCSIMVMPKDKRIVLVDLNVADARNNLEYYNVLHRAIVVQQDFHQFARESPASKWSHIFIDHNHSYEDNSAAIRYFWPQLNPGGIISFHDYGHTDYPGVKKAVDEFSQTKNAKLFHPGWLCSFMKVP